MKFSTLSTALLGAGVASALSPVTISGNKFFDSNGNQFFLKGIAYQLTPDDPLVDAAQCALDATLMKTLGANSIRVYHVDPTADHSGCMKEFDNAGIYTLIDLDTFSSYILPNAPTWSKSQYDAYAAVIDAFAQYDNVLGFYIGNEVIAQNNQSMAAPFIKAATRDMKTYRDSKKYRSIPIGYSAADIAELRPALQDYLTCGGNPADNIDFFSLNSYEWCGNVDFQTSGYVNLENMSSNFPVPIFFSETGCNTAPPRTFSDQAAIFGPDMVGDWSGALIYEWIEESNNYGLISYGPAVDPTVVASNVQGGYTRAGTPTPVLPDFTNLKSQWATITPSGVKSADYDPKKVSTRDCPTSSAGGWLLDGNVALPTLGATFSGTYATAATTVVTSLPTGSSGGSGGASGTSGGNQGTGTGSPSAAKTSNPASASNQIAGMGAGLVSVMLFFTFWL